MLPKIRFIYKVADYIFSATLFHMKEGKYMDSKFNFNQITKTLEKIFEAGFNTERKILNMKLEDLTKIPSLQSNETLILIEIKKALKSRTLLSLLSGVKE